MAEEEYREQKSRHEFLVRQRDDLRASIAQTKEAIVQIDQESRDRFLGALPRINKNFQELFEALFKGGTAEVRLTDEANPWKAEWTSSPSRRGKGSGTWAFSRAAKSR